MNISEKTQLSISLLSSFAFLWASGHSSLLKLFSSTACGHDGNLNWLELETETRGVRKTSESLGLSLLQTLEAKMFEDCCFSTINISLHNRVTTQAN